MTLNWEMIARSEMNAVRQRVLDLVLTSPAPDGAPGWSARLVARELGVPLENISYHVRTLYKHGLLRRVSRRKGRRSAIETFYLPSARVLKA